MEAPWNHPTRTHMAPLCHLDRALPLERLRFHDDGTMRALGLHHRNTLATRIRHRDSTVLGRKEPQRTPVPNPIRPILCAGWPSTKNGAAGSDCGRNRARRLLGTKPRVPASEATAPFAAACRVAATRGLVVCCDGVILVPSNPPAQKSLRSCHPCHNLPCATAYFRLHQTHHGQPFRVRHLRAQHTGHLGQLPFDAQANV